jgi:hypothetical protein
MKGFMMHLTRKQLLKSASSLLIGVLVVTGVLIFYNLNRASIHDELIALDLLPKPEKMTELYFNDSTKLPDSATRNQTISFTFVIHNLETTNYQYLYEVSVIANGTPHIVDSGSVFVKDNEYFVKDEKFHLMNVSGGQKVVVELLNKHQSIDFWAGK